MKTTFKEYIEYCIAKDLEFDAVIGDVDVDCTFCFCPDMKITDYCMEEYGDLLNSPCEVLADKTGRYADVVVVEYDNYCKGRQFAWALAGYIKETEYKKLFETDEKFDL